MKKLLNNKKDMVIVDLEVIDTKFDSKLPMVIVKKAIGVAPFDLVYGIHARIPQKKLDWNV